MLFQNRISLQPNATLAKLRGGILKGKKLDYSKKSGETETGEIPFL